MKVRELIKLLKANDCYLVAHGKEHDKWYSFIIRFTERSIAYEKVFLSCCIYT